jgi:SAM-dependent methyltransferase
MTTGNDGAAEVIRRYWDVDAATYDDSAGHNPRHAVVRAAWRGALAALAGPAPARVLDVGAGTGFLSLLLAESGFEVTALDLSNAMLARLKAKASAAALAVEIVEGDALSPPDGRFDVVVERHLLWTLPDPAGALEAWHASAPDGRLVLVEGLWGASGGPVERARRQLSDLLRRARGVASDHHRPYDAEMLSQLPLGAGPEPADLVALVEASSWGTARLIRLRDVEWAERLAMPAPEQLLGANPRFSITAGRPATLHPTAR